MNGYTSRSNCGVAEFSPEKYRGLVGVRMNRLWSDLSGPMNWIRRYTKMNIIFLL